MPECPVCNVSVANDRGLASHFRHQSETHPDYKTWQADQRWAGKTEPEDYVSCQECGLKALSLTGHLRTHSLSSEQYREKHGAQALLRSLNSQKDQCEAITKARLTSSAYEGTKKVSCTVCPATYEAHKLATPGMCPACKTAAEDGRWAGKTEPEDYVTCRACGHRAISLVSHIQAEHPDYQDLYPGTPQMAQTVTQKWHLRGVPLSDETRTLMSQNAGRWNLGLTKEDHPSLARQAEKMLGKPCWSKGLTAAEDERLRGTVEKLKLYIGENRPWHNGLRVDLTLDDIQPLLDKEGRVNRQKALALGIPWQACQRYMSTYGLEISDDPVKARAEAQYIRLTAEQLLPYRLKNGKLVAAWAASRLGVSSGVVIREADRLGISRYKWGLSQGLCLGTVSEVLGGASWKDEWRDTRFRNPPTGHRYKFDGYFPSHNLVVEFHGYQHFVFPNAFHKTEAQYLASRKRDQHKRELIQGSEDLLYLEVRYDEPFDDVMYLKGRLDSLTR